MVAKGLAAVHLINHVTGIAPALGAGERDLALHTLGIQIEGAGNDQYQLAVTATSEQISIPYGSVSHLFFVVFYLDSLHFRVWVGGFKDVVMLHNAAVDM